MSRPARALVNAQALQHNLKQVRRHAAKAKVMAIIKANGYGHGLAWAGRALQKADAFGVASLDEALVLRQVGLQQPICLLGGFFDPTEIPLIRKHRLSPVIHMHEQIEQLTQNTAGDSFDIWIKIDTGMHRLGFDPQDMAVVLAKLKSCKGVGQIRVMSHLANADDRADETPRRQMKCFTSVADVDGMERSLANSAGVIAWPDSHYDWVRPGIMLYGVSPMLDHSAADLDLLPAMSLQTQLMAIHQRRKGDRVGYGGDWVCPEDMSVGVAAVGYGDGYPRHAPAGTPVLVNTKTVPLIGRVSMDMITLDLRGVPEARIGDRVVLWGDGLPVEDIARNAGTIGYELLCHVTERIPRTE